MSAALATVDTVTGREPIKVIADILKAELELEDGQIMLSYQKFNIPETTGLYIALSYLSEKVIANNNYFAADGNGIKETQETAIQNLIQIDLMSFDATARLEKEHVIQALRSIYSQQAQEAARMKIASIPISFVDASSLEETKIMNRYAISIMVHALYSRTKVIPGYFNQFPVTAAQDANVPQISFEAESTPSF